MFVLNPGFIFYDFMLLLFTLTVIRRHYITSMQFIFDLSYISFFPCIFLPLIPVFFFFYIYLFSLPFILSFGFSFFNLAFLRLVVSIHYIIITLFGLRCSSYAAYPLPSSSLLLPPSLYELSCRVHSSSYFSVIHPSPLLSPLNGGAAICLASDA